MYSSYKLFKHNQHYDAIVIGSGISGLTVASLLSKEKKRVLVLEQHYKPGGFTHTFKRNHYEWDVGVHYLGDVGEQKTIMRAAYDFITETPIEWADMGSVYDISFLGDNRYEFHKGKDAFIQYFSRLFPEEHKSLKRYVALLQKVDRYAYLYQAPKAMPALLTKTLGWLMQRPFMRFASRTTQEVLDELFTSNELKAVLCTQYGDYGLPPSQSSFAIHALVCKHYLNGGYYPVGGSAQFFDKIAPVIKNAGGQILVRAEVKEIRVENNAAVGVRMHDGKEFRAAKIISTVGVYNTYNHLLPQEEVEKHNLRQSIAKFTPSIGYYCLYIGCRNTAQELELPRSNYWIFPHNDHDRAMKDYVEGKSDVWPVVYVSFPGAKDPTFTNRFPGRSTLEIIVPVPFIEVEKWKDSRWKHRGEEYDALKEKVSQRMLEYLYTYVPQVKGKIDYYELSTPLSTAHFTNYQRGEMYGINHTPQRFLNKSLQPRTPIRNFFMAGQDITGCGVAGAMMSGYVCAGAITGRIYLKMAWDEFKRRTRKP